MLKCGGCKYNDCCTKVIRIEMENCTEYLPLTNADRIRAMTGEELAHLLMDIAMEAVDFVVGKRESVRFPMSSYVGTWLDWLKQEADDGN